MNDQEPIAHFSLRPADICPKCQQPVDVVSPNWLTFAVDFNNNRFTWEERDHEPDLCLDCTINALPSGVRTAWAPTAAMLESARSEIALRRDITLFHTRTSNTHVYRRTGGVYQVDNFFVIMNGEPNERWKIPGFILNPNGGKALSLLIIRMVLSLEGVTAKVVVTWDFTNFYERRARFEIIDWEDATQQDLRRLMEVGVQFGNHLRTGRPRGPVHSKQDYIDMYRTVEKMNGRPRSMEAFCEAANISSDTLRDNLRRWGMKWSEFRQAADEA